MVVKIVLNSVKYNDTEKAVSWVLKWFRSSDLLGNIFLVAQQAAWSIALKNEKETHRVIQMVHEEEKWQLKELGKLLKKQSNFSFSIKKENVVTVPAPASSL